MGDVSKFTKFKFIAGHLILLAAAVAAVWFIHGQASRLSAGDPGEKESRTRIFLISKTLTRLYEAETLGIAISRAADGERLSAYSRIIREVKRDMDSLRRLVPDPRQEQQINAVKALLDQKIENMKALVAINLRHAPVDLYDRFARDLSALRDTTLAAPEIRVRREVSVDSAYIQPPKRGFWSIFRSKPAPVLQVNTSEHIVLDTLPPAARAPYQNADTALLAIRSAWVDYQERERLQAQELYRQEIATLRNGQHVSEQIKHILTELEGEEVRATLARADSREEIASDLTRVIAAIAMIASLFVIIFIALMLNDISRGQRYRKALEEANRYAQKLLDGREKLMLTVSHDIKSPLNSITGYVELLDNTPLADRQHYFLDNMKRSATHILQLVNNLLDYSRLEAGKMEVDAIRYSPGKLLAETAEAFLPLAGQKGLALASRVDEALYPDRVGDPIKIRQIVINLLSNAIKYTGAGSVTLAASPAGDDMEISVADTGGGMTAEEQHLIFEEFTRLDARHNNGAAGTGLGLTITRHLVQLLGGSITLASAKGEGSTFTVRLPLGEPPALPLPSVSPDPLVPPSLHALIIDDDPLQLEMIAEFLRQKGISCETCDRVDKALALLETSSFHLLLTDIQMPGLDGFELLAHIRQSPREEIRALPVIAQSAKGDMHENDYLRVGFSAYLNKPYTPAQLLACIARLFNCPAPPSPEPLPSTGEKEYDLTTIRLFADNDERAVREIIASFIRDCRTHFQLLQEHVECGDYPAVQRLAHKMLPMFRQLLVNAVTPDLAYLEQQTDDKEKIKEAARRIIDKGGAIIETMERELINLSSE